MERRGGRILGEWRRGGRERGGSGGSWWERERENVREWGEETFEDEGERSDGEEREKKKQWGQPKEMCGSKFRCIDSYLRLLLFPFTPPF